MSRIVSIRNGCRGALFDANGKEILGVVSANLTNGRVISLVRHDGIVTGERDICYHQAPLRFEPK